MLRALMARNLENLELQEPLAHRELRERLALLEHLAVDNHQHLEVEQPLRLKNRQMENARKKSSLVRKNLELETRKKKREVTRYLAILVSIQEVALSTLIQKMEEKIPVQLSQLLLVEMMIRKIQSQEAFKVCKSYCYAAWLNIPFGTVC